MWGSVLYGLIAGYVNYLSGTRVQEYFDRYLIQINLLFSSGAPKWFCHLRMFPVYRWKEKCPKLLFKIRNIKMNSIKKFLRDEEGLTTVGYAIAGGLVGAAVIAIFGSLQELLLR